MLRNTHNVSKRVTMEHCFKEEGKHEITKKKKTLYLQGQKNYMKGKIYLKQQLLRDSFELKRCGKGTTGLNKRKNVWNTNR